MRTSKAEFSRRLATLPHRVSLQQIEWLTGVTREALNDWRAHRRFPEPMPPLPSVGDGRAEPEFDRDEVSNWCLDHLFRPAVGERPSDAPARPGLPHHSGERLRAAEIGRRRRMGGTNPSAAIANLAAKYAQDPSHPFPPRGDDKRYDGAAVARWFAWYDREHGASRYVPLAPGQREHTARVEELVQAAYDAGGEITSEQVADELAVHLDLARRHLMDAAALIADRCDLISRGDALDLLPPDLTVAQRRSRLKYLLNKPQAPRPVLKIANAYYYQRSELARFLREASRPDASSPRPSRKSR